VAKKSKANAAASGKVSKARASTKSRSPRTRKSSSPKEPAIEKVAAEAAGVAASAFDPTDDQIQMRAYFISERRRRLDLPGDANSDWLEAKRQLLAETRH
jgi:hypothetical protein